MGWSISFRLKSGEEIIDTSREADKGIIQPVYSIVLTNQRVLFNFVPMSSPLLGSSIWNSFTYNEISRVEVVTRLLIKYLMVKTPIRDYYLNVSNPDYWAEKIKDFKEKFSEPPQ